MASAFFPFDVTHLLSGPARLLRTPIATALPTDPADIFLQVAPYTPTTDWDDWGGTDAPPEYSTGRTINSWKIQQQTAAVYQEVTEQVRTVKIPSAELTAELLQIIENAPEIAALAAATGMSAFQEVAFGSSVELAQYRIALAAKYPLQAGIVIEGIAGPSRGRMIVQLFNRCSLTATASTMSLAIGEMAHVDVEMTLFPEPGLDEGQEYGTHWIEDAGTIALV